MSDCKSCGDFRTVARFTMREAGLTFEPQPFAGGKDDTIALNHPEYDNLSVCWQMMRDSVAGQDAMKANAYAQGYIRIPPGLKGKDKAKCSEEAQDYIERGRFPEVPLRHILEIEGQLFKNSVDVEGSDKLLAVVNDIDGESLSLEERAREVVGEYFKVFRKLAYIQYNEEQKRPEVIWYNAEQIVNWKMGKDGFPSLIVLQEECPSDDTFAHESTYRRIMLSIEEGVFSFRSFLLDDDEWLEETDKASVPTRTGDALTRIPAVLFGSWKSTPPPLKPITETCVDYFRADTEWAHSLYYSAHPTLFANIDEGGTVLSADVDDNGEMLPYDIDIGAACAHVFRKGVLAYAEPSGAAHAALKDRVIERRNELAGLGARSFVNYSASNITAMTENMQQSGERGVMSSFARDISARFTEVLIWVADMMGEPVDDVEFRIDQTVADADFDLKVLPSVFELVDRGVIGNTRLREYIRCNEPKLTGGLTDEELDREINEENAGFVSTDILGALP